MSSLHNASQHTTILAFLLFSISLLPCDSFADAASAPFVTKDELNTEIASRTAADANLQTQINNLATPTTFEIGDTGPNGGIVYYVDGSGEHGLEARTEDFSEQLAWSQAFNAVSLIGPGWHLPTKTELELLFEQKFAVGGLKGGFYWSSTRSGGTHAWSQTFADGAQSPRDMAGNKFNARVVHIF